MKKIIILMTLIYGFAFTQEDNNQDYISNLAGPRIGFTILPNETFNNAKDVFDGMTYPIVSQFGWQFETTYFADEGVQGLAEFAFLVGGVDQNAFLPSITAMIGMRFARSEFEFALGPNLSFTGMALALAVGKNYKVGNLNFPVSFVLVPSTDGARISMIVGFLGASNYRKNKE